MDKKIYYIDRATREKKEEKICGNQFLELLYSDSFWFKLVRQALCRFSFSSQIFGWIQKKSLSRRYIIPFIKEYEIDTEEFLDPVENFSCFNDFFTRKLNLSCRPIAPEEEIAVLPADARYLVYPSVKKGNPFTVKKRPFILDTFLQDPILSSRYTNGAMVIARLAPVDYHRFHFPCDALALAPKTINGYLYSVNPKALANNYAILHENKRVLTELHTKRFGTVLCVEVGATNVGSIHQTFTPEMTYAKGEEKGFFSFGGSSLILLFEEERICFENDLIEASEVGVEVLGKMGQPLGRVY